jgi:hypothetical protein
MRSLLRSGRSYRPWGGIVHLFIFVACISRALAQPADLQYRIIYKEKTETYYFRSDPDWEPGQLEIAGLLPVVIVDSVVKDVTLDNRVTTTTFHLENSSNREWMVTPYKRVITDSELKTFDAGNKLMRQYKLPNTITKSAQNIRNILNETGADIIPDFPYMTDALKSQLESAGFSIVKLPGGAFECTSEAGKIIINNKALFTEALKYLPDGSVSHYERNIFIKNDLDQVVPAVKITRVPDTRFEEGKVYRIDLTTYSEYSIVYGPGSRWANTDNRGGDMFIFPNPVDQLLLVDRIGTFTDQCTYAIYDFSGRLLMQGEWGAAADGKIDVSRLSEGQYLLVVMQQNDSIRKSFVKL